MKSFWDNSSTAFLNLVLSMAQKQQSLYVHILDIPSVALIPADRGALQSNANSPNAYPLVMVFFTWSWMMTWHVPCSNMKQEVALSFYLKMYSSAATKQQNIFNTMSSLSHIFKWFTYAAPRSTRRSSSKIWHSILIDNPSDL